MTIEQALNRVYEEKSGEHSPASAKTALDAINALLELNTLDKVDTVGEGVYQLLTSSTGGRTGSISGTLETIADDIDATLGEFGMEWDTFMSSLTPDGGMSAYIEIRPDETAQQAGAARFWCPFWHIGERVVGFTSADQASEGARIVELAIYGPDALVDRTVCGFYDTSSGTWVSFNELFSHVSYELSFTLVY